MPRTSYAPVATVVAFNPVPSTDTEALPSGLPALSDTVPRMEPACASAAAQGTHANSTPDSTLTMPRTMRPPLSMTRIGASGAGPGAVGAAPQNRRPMRQRQAATPVRLDKRTLFLHIG